MYYKTFSLNLTSEKGSTTKEDKRKFVGKAREKWLLACQNRMQSFIYDRRRLQQISLMSAKNTIAILFFAIIYQNTFCVQGRVIDHYTPSHYPQEREKEIDGLNFVSKLVGYGGELNRIMTIINRNYLIYYHSGYNLITPFIPLE